MTNTYTIGIAGSTQHTTTCAQAIAADPRFEVSFVLTPSPKALGRKQIVTENPLHEWANLNSIPSVLIDTKITTAVRSEVENVNLLGRPIDFLLVVDFGYLVPNWLLELPKLAPLNVHPSALPDWRGSSPGQFVLLSGAKRSAFTLMRMSPRLDDGPIIWQEWFDVNPIWTHADYYQTAFSILAPGLAGQIAAYAQSVIDGSPAHTLQPELSPTPVARRLTKEDGMVAWQRVKKLINGEIVEDDSSDSPLLHELTNNSGQSWLEILPRAARALSPWPGLWTIVPTSKGPKRMKLLSILIAEGKLALEQVQIEGQLPAAFSAVKNLIDD